MGSAESKSSSNTPWQSDHSHLHQMFVYSNRFRPLLNYTVAEKKGIKKLRQHLHILVSNSHLNTLLISPLISMRNLSLINLTNAAGMHCWMVLHTVGCRCNYWSCVPFALFTRHFSFLLSLVFIVIFFFLYKFDFITQY